jgi:predicted small lipoprotein YifL
MSAVDRAAKSRPAGLVLLLTLLAACGQTGPLYLPDAPAEAAAAGAVQPGAEDDDAEGPGSESP